MGTPHSTLSTLDQLLLYIEIRFSRTYDIASDPERPGQRQRTFEGRTLHGFHPDDEKSWHWPAGGIPLRRSSKSFCLPDLEACRRSHHSDPGLSSTATSKTLVSSSLSPSKIRDPKAARRSIGLWLGSQRGENPIFETRFEAWFATHLQVALMEESLRRVEAEVKDWEVCYKSCCTLRKRLKNAYVALRVAREALEGLGAARGRTMSRGRRSGVLRSRSRSRSMSSSSDVRATELNVCPESWLQNERIHVSDGPAVLKGCTELDDLQKSIMKRPVGITLTLPGVDIDGNVPLDDAIRDLHLMTSSDPFQEHIDSLRYFTQLVRSSEEKIQQALLDTEVVISMLATLIKASAREEESLKCAFEKTMPDLWERWWRQMEFMEDAASWSGGGREGSCGGEGDGSCYMGQSPVDSFVGSKRISLTQGK